jgi:hypothetical protein
MPIERAISKDVNEVEPGLWSNCLHVDRIVNSVGLTYKG